MEKQRGEIATATVIIIAVVTVLFAPLVLKNGNPFDRSADPSNRRTASAISGRDIVNITNAVADSEKPVTVHVDRSIEASSEVTDPKLTLGQRIGRFFEGLGTWAVVGVLFAVFVLGVSPAAILAWSRARWKGFSKNLVGGVRLLGKEDPEAYEKVTKKIGLQQKASGKARRDEKLVDKVKSEMH